MILKKGHRENVVPAFKRLNIIIIDACTDHEVAGSIPGTSTNFKCGFDLAWGPPNLVWTIGQLLDWEVADRIKKLDINRLDEA